MQDVTHKLLRYKERQDSAAVGGKRQEEERRRKKTLVLGIEPRQKQELEQLHSTRYKASLLQFHIFKYEFLLPLESYM
ncbi:hypothetical protein FD723_26960 [Nostoc sp. C052]|uniref:hypothetical protein n=1 Tax=Nostoc sp. C052 TaxID=2576902 RepID=UPI0015C3E24A|nr:hypothetical protein [Nostoc sp. C052]QLE43722.1 hypothetical protein FD723_26960 [Nostoc sp. C052]